MASTRAQRILKLVQSTSPSQTEGSTTYTDSKIVVKDQVVVHSPTETDEQTQSSCDEILSDTSDHVYEIDPRLIRSCKKDNRDINTQTKKQSSLVPDYDSDGSSIYENNNKENIPNNDTKITKSLPKSCSSSSSSSNSSSSSSSSSCSSDSDSSTSSSQSDQHSKYFAERVHESNNLDTVNKENHDNILIFPSTSQSTESHLRHNNVRPERSPVFSDESEDIDLSDDDPTYELSTNRKKTRNYFFDSLNTALSDTSDDEISDSSNAKDLKMSSKGRKRSRHSPKWKQNKAKRLRNTGTTYVSISKSGKIIPGRCLKIPCTEKCKLKCTDNISTHERYDIFKEFWDLGDITKQRSFINSCMTEITPKYRYTNASNPRRPNKAYYFTVNSKKIRVCKTFFKSTLYVTDRMIFTVQTKLNQGGFMLEDLRGKHQSHKTHNPDLIHEIRNHIQSIPKIESHYLRSTISKEYIDGGKTIKDLFNDFAKQQDENGKETGNYITYYKIFKSEFNLSFYIPKKDQCDLCLSYSNGTNEKKKEIEEKYNTHIEEKSLSRFEKQQDRSKITNDDRVVIYDLEAVLQCPRGDTSSFYYKSKLNSYNLTLTELSKTNSKTAYEQVHCYFWTESEAKRGAIEIGSCIWQYLVGICKESAVDEQNIIFYSDNCCGQNKNKYIATLYLYAVHSLNIRSIKHKFLIRGHTQNEADSVHSLIEKEVKKNLKSGPIYSPDQYIALIKNAKKSKPAINVHELTYDSFLDMKLLQEEWGYNYNTNTQGQTVNWNDIKMLMMAKEKPFSIFYKVSYKDDDYKEIDVRNKRKKMKMITDISLEKAYTEKQEISINKKKDLKELINKGLIPPFYANYYNSIIN